MSSIRLSKNLLTSWRGLAGLILLLALMTGSITFAQERPGYLRLVRAIPAGDVGVSNPVGLAFSPGASAFLVLEAGDAARPGDTTTSISLVSPLEDTLGAVRVATAIADPLNVAVDSQANRLLILDQAANQLIAVRLRAQGYPDPADSAVTRFEAGPFGVTHAQGLTLDPETGRLFILDAAAHRIVGIIPDAQQGFDGQIFQIDLRHLGGAPLRGLAFSPNTGHLHVSSPVEQKLYELSESGRVVSTRDLAPLKLMDLQGMVFAPSGDPTDDPAIMNLYLADSGLSAAPSQPSRRGAILEVALTPPVLVALPASIQASLVQTIDTSQWNPPSPDPVGIEFRPATGRLLVSDSEVDEMPPYWAGVNVFEATTGGALVATCTTSPAFSNEPVGVAVNPTNGHIFFSDDERQKIHEVNLGPDGDYCTADDTRTQLSTSSFVSSDPEGLAYGEGMLFVGDGLGREVYKISPGANGVFDGAPPSGDDVVTNFDTSVIGQQDPEGLAYNSAHGTLYIVSRDSTEITEVWLDGTVTNVIDISSLNAVSPGGLAYGPGSVNPGVMNLYIAARGVDNEDDPLENDGKVYEITGLPEAGPTPTPTNTPTPPDTPTPSNTPTPTPVVSTVSFAPDADARVEEPFPNTNFGRSFLKTDGGTDPDVESYLRFTVSGVSGAVLSARLRVFATTDTANGPAVYPTSNDWAELGITWNTRPAPTGGAVDDKGAIGTNTWVEYNVTSLVLGDGVYSFLLAIDNTDGIEFSSREGLQPPQLVLTFSPNTPTPTSTPTPTFLTLASTPDADARVEEARPDHNYGTADTLRAIGGAGPALQSYLRFTVTGVAGTIQTARLRVFATSPTANGPAVYATPHRCSETTITWNT